jgi:hypothetical protein
VECLSVRLDLPTLIGDLGLELRDCSEELPGDADVSLSQPVEELAHLRVTPLTPTAELLAHTRILSERLARDGHAGVETVSSATKLGAALFVGPVRGADHGG